MVLRGKVCDIIYREEDGQESLNPDRKYVVLMISNVNFGRLYLVNIQAFVRHSRFRYA